MTTSEPEILFNVSGGIGWLVFNRPAARSSESR